VHLLTDQIEFADVVILNKVADAGPERTDAARKIIRSLNADAEIIETNHSEVAAEKILDTGLFDFEKAHEHPMWAKELYGFADHVPETEEYGVAVLCLPRPPTLRAREDPGVLNGDMPGVIRAKGHFWIATRPEWVAEFSLAGALSSVKPLGTWWAAVPRDAGPSTMAAVPISRSTGSSPGATGGRRSSSSAPASTGPALKARLWMPACCPNTSRPGPTRSPTCPILSPLPAAWKRLLTRPRAGRAPRSRTTTTSATG
jgi:G3E family GTPase